MDFSERELKELTISALVLALAFAIVFEGGLGYILREQDAFYWLARSFLICLIGVSLGFVLHELGHRFVARRFNCVAEFEMWPTGLVLALVMALAVGFVFASPGAVVIRSRRGFGYGILTKREMGIISITGPAINFCLSIVFLLLLVVSLRYYDLGSFWNDVFLTGAFINAVLSALNLIPVGPFDGRKVFNWDRVIWGAAIAVTGALTVFLFLWWTGRIELNL